MLLMCLKAVSVVARLELKSKIFVVAGMRVARGERFAVGYSCYRNRTRRVEACEEVEEAIKVSSGASEGVD
jgi:hypothetical protein